MTQALLSVLQRNAWQALRARDWDQLASILEQLRLHDPLSRHTRGLELEYLVGCGRIAEARGLATTLVEQFPDSPRIRLLAGKVAYRAREYAEAAEHFREGDRLNPHLTTRWWLGRVLTALRRFDEAEVLLQEVTAACPRWASDLAWLYECKQEPLRALRVLDEHRKVLGESEFISAQRERVQAQMLEADELLDEVTVLRELGEGISDSVLPTTLAAYLDTGQMQEARNLVAERIGTLEPRIATSAGWEAYHRQAWDLAFDLFRAGFSKTYANRKLLNSLQSAAKRAGKVEELIELYGGYVDRNGGLYGRIQKLERHG